MEPNVDVKEEFMMICDLLVALFCVDPRVWPHLVAFCCARVCFDNLGVECCRANTVRLH